MAHLYSLLRILHAAQLLSYGVGIDFPAALKVVKEAMKWNFEPLRRYGIHVDKILNDQQKLEQAIGLIESNFREIDTKVFVAIC